MIRHIDGYYIAAQIRLLRQVHKGTVLILEGQDDAKIFDKFVDHSGCKTEVAFGKPNALKALDLLEDEGVLGVLAIVDSDFDRLLQTENNLENLYLTDLHDIDLTMFCSPALETYLREHGDKALLEKNFNDRSADVRARIMQACLPLACCRLEPFWFEITHSRHG